MQIALVVGFCLSFLFPICARSQTDSTQQKIASSPNSISSKSLNAIDSKYSSIQHQVQHSMAKMLSRMQRMEANLQSQMKAKDSLKSQQLFGASQATYQQLAAQANAPATGANNISTAQSLTGRPYFPAVDSVRTAMGFLQQGECYTRPIGQ